jgi:hypothetical protein
LKHLLVKRGQPEGDRLHSTRVHCGDRTKVLFREPRQTDVRLLRDFINPFADEPRSGLLINKKVTLKEERAWLKSRLASIKEVLSISHPEQGPALALPDGVSCLEDSDPPRSTPGGRSIGSGPPLLRTTPRSHLETANTSPSSNAAQLILFAGYSEGIGDRKTV